MYPRRSLSTEKTYDFHQEETEGPLASIPIRQVVANHNSILQKRETYLIRLFRFEAPSTHSRNSFAIRNTKEGCVLIPRCRNALSKMHERVGRTSRPFGSTFVYVGNMGREERPSPSSGSKGAIEGFEPVAIPFRTGIDKGIRIGLSFRHLRFVAIGMAAAVASAGARRDGISHALPREITEEDIRRIQSMQRQRADPQAALAVSLAREKHLAKQVSALQNRVEALASALLEMRQERDAYLKELYDARKVVEDVRPSSTARQEEWNVDNVPSEPSSTRRCNHALESVGMESAVCRARREVDRCEEELERSWVKLLVVNAVESSECAEAASILASEAARKAIETERAELERKRRHACEKIVRNALLLPLSQEAAERISTIAIQRAILRARRRMERFEDKWRKEAQASAVRIASNSTRKAIENCPVRRCADNAIWSALAKDYSPRLAREIMETVLNREAAQCRKAARLVVQRAVRNILWCEQVDKYAPLIAHQALKSVVMRDMRECLSISRAISRKSVANAAWNAESALAARNISLLACNKAIENEYLECASCAHSVATKACSAAIAACPVRLCMMKAIDSALSWEAASILSSKACAVALNNCPVRRLAISACEGPVIQEKAILLSRQLLAQAVESDAHDCLHYARSHVHAILRKLLLEEKLAKEKARAAREAKRKEKLRRDQMAAAARRQQEALLRRAGISGKGNLSKSPAKRPESQHKKGRGSHVVRNISAALGMGAGTVAMVFVKVWRSAKPKALQMHCKSFSVLKEEGATTRAHRRTLDNVLREDFGM